MDPEPGVVGLWLLGVSKSSKPQTDTDPGRWGKVMASPKIARKSSNFTAVRAALYAPRGWAGPVCGRVVFFPR